MNRILRPAFSVAMSVALLLSTNACHSNASNSPAPESAESPIAAPVGTDPPNTTPDDPVVAAALSADAERDGVVGTPVDPRTLTPAQLQFGRPPKLDPSVTYQSGVLVMEHGDTAIRSMDSNGLIWHFDPNAPQVGQIQEGAIIFATERCVGRVLHVDRTGNDIAVAVGPVQLTDLIDKGHFVYNQPLDLNSMVAVPVPDLPVVFSQDPFGKASPSASASDTPSGIPSGTPSGVPSDTPSGVPSGTPSGVPSDTPGVPSGTPSGVPSGTPSGAPAQTPSSGAGASTSATGHYRLASVTYAIVTAGRWKPYRVVSYDAQGGQHQRLLRPKMERIAQIVPPIPPAANGLVPNIPAPPASIGIPKNVNINGMDVWPCSSNCSGLGVEMQYDKGGLKIYSYATFFLRNPHIHFDIDILHGIRTIGITLQGAGGFEAHFAMGASEAFNGNIHFTGPVPLDLSFPIDVSGFPLAIHLIQSLVLNTGFSARTSTLSATLKFQACCQLGIGYFNNGWGTEAPKMSVDYSRTNVAGLSVGINDLSFALKQEILVGVGVAGFATGPYMALTTGIAAIKQSSITPIDCRMATLTMDFSAGIGYTTPKVLTSIFNVFLKIIGASPIAGSGSFAESKPYRMVTFKGESRKGCAG